MAIRAASLYLPICLLAVVWLLRRPTARLRVGLLLGFSWNMATLPLLQLLAERAGWWRFADTGTLFLGMPLELYLGWSLFWGAVPQLAFARVWPMIVLGLMAIVDLLAMPGMAPVLSLGPGWMLGEVCGLLLCFLPAQYAARWTADDRNVFARVVVQAGAFGGIFLMLIPAAILTETGGSWDNLFDQPDWLGSILAQCLLLLMLPGLAAAFEFARHGGTPLPFDAPKRLVLTGPYAYVANPMQLSAVLVLFTWSAWLGDWLVAAGGVVAFVYGLGFAEWSEAHDLEKRFGTRWLRYRGEVRAWFPRARPYVEKPATMYIAGGCDRCSQVRGWFERRHPSELLIVNAESHPTRDLERISYAGNSGEEQGVAALARGLEHLHLGWAVVGWAMRLPVVVQLLQLLVDASGGEAMLVRRGAPVSCNLAAHLASSPPGAREPGIESWRAQPFD